MERSSRLCKEEKRKEGLVMKRLSVLLAVCLLASSALADVRIVVEPNEGLAKINYDTDGEKVRAFALDITVDAGAIIDITGFIRGESTAENPGYGIFPANFGRYITVDAESGEVAAWDIADYTPVADPCDPGALGGLGTEGITIEMGALYYPADDNSPNAPPNSGTLCTLVLSDVANVSVSLNEARGGIVLTDPELVATVDLSGAEVVLIGGEDDMQQMAEMSVSSGLLAPSHPDYAEWVAVGKPVCWTYPRQCHGDADGALEGNSENGFSYVGPADLEALTAAWQVKEPPFGPGIASVQNGICADFARDQEGNETTGFYRVGSTDLNHLVQNWLVKEAPNGPGVAGDCGGNRVP
jgi:hypothetical protein